MLENFERIDILFAANLSTNPSVQLILQKLLAAFRKGALYYSVTEDEQIVLKESSLLGTELFLESNKLFLARNYHAYQECFKQLERIEKAPLNSFPLDSDIPFFSKVQNNAFTILTGGPGTGKSTLITQLVKKCKNFSFVIATPTGKSAQRIKEMFSDAYVMTLHKLIAQYHSYPFFPFDLVVLDECSMIDLQHFQKIFEKVASGSRIVLVGDYDQLPPVEGCGFFRNLIEEKSKQTVTLDQVFRTDSLPLLKIAADIRRGQFPPSLEIPPLEEFVNSYFHNFYQNGASLHAVSLRMKQLQLLTPFKKGMFGSENLNAKLFTLAEQKHAEAIPIIITKNDEYLAVANGDKGVLYENKIFLEAERVISKYQVQFQLAFALSVHKSQGSEVESVVIVLPKGSEHFGRELIYTAVTRAKKEAIIYAESFCER